jgi:hypothetical protein
VGGALILALLWMLGRGAQGTDPQVIQLTIDAASTQANVSFPTLAANLTSTPIDAALTGAAPTLALSGRAAVQQFAASAQATSQLSEIDWSASQAAGPPNTPECGDFRTAWSPSGMNTTEALTLYFPQLVVPTGLQVYQTFNIGFISQINVVDTFGEVHTVYQAAAQGSPACPATLPISIEADYPANIVVIFVDQTSLVNGHPQIDAVELLGIRY